jgi:hypothetical protein
MILNKTVCILGHETPVKDTGCVSHFVPHLIKASSIVLGLVPGALICLQYIFGAMKLAENLVDCEHHHSSIKADSNNH